MEIHCPFCDKVQTQKPMKSWTYGKMFKKRTKDGMKWGAAIRCSRYECHCGKLFNYYITSKNKTWTNPKSKRAKS